MSSLIQKKRKNFRTAEKTLEEKLMDEIKTKFEEKTEKFQKWFYTLPSATKSGSRSQRNMLYFTSHSGDINVYQMSWTPFRVALDQLSGCFQLQTTWCLRKETVSTLQLLTNCCKLALTIQLNLSLNKKFETQILIFCFFFRRTFLSRPFLRRSVSAFCLRLDP